MKPTAQPTRVVFQFGDHASVTYTPEPAQPGDYGKRYHAAVINGRTSSAWTVTHPLNKTNARRLILKTVPEILTKPQTPKP